MDIHSKVPNQAFRDNFDLIFGKKEEVHSTGGPGSGRVVIGKEDIQPLKPVMPETVNVSGSIEQTIHKV